MHDGARARRSRAIEAGRYYRAPVGRGGVSHGLTEQESDVDVTGGGNVSGGGGDDAAALAFRSRPLRLAWSAATAASSSSTAQSEACFREAGLSAPPERVFFRVLAIVRRSTR